MLFTVIFIGLVGGSLGEYSEAVPEILSVEEFSHSAKITVDPKSAPAGTDRVQIQAMELNDLTGNRYEDGYILSYNAKLHYFYYPQLNEAMYHVFKLKFGKPSAPDEVTWTQFSAETHYHHSDSSKFEFVDMERDWSQARDYCLGIGKRLAVITNKNMNGMVEKLLRPKKVETAWIGLYDKHYNDKNPTTTWKWVDGSPYKYKNFEYGATIVDSTPQSSAVAINGQSGEWVTRDPHDKMVFLCVAGKTEHAKTDESNLGINEMNMQKKK